MKNIIAFLSKYDILKDVLFSFAVVIFVLVFLRITKKIADIFHKKIGSRTKTDVDDKIIDIIERAVRSGVILCGIYFFFLSFNFLLGKSFYSYLNGILYILLVFAVAKMITSVIQVLYEWYGSNSSIDIKSKLQDDFGPLFRRLIVIVVYTIAVITLLKHFNQDISSIVVSLGVGSLAIALAAKDTLENMISGFLIVTDRPFRINDRIMLENGTVGDVYDIGLRSTKIKTFDNTLIIVPNQQIVNEKVTNLSYPDPQIRVAVEVGVGYGSDIDQVKKILLDICKSHPDVLEYPEPVAYFKNFGDSALEFKIMCRVDKWGKQYKVAEDLRIRIKEVFEQNNIEIPFPHQVVYLPDKKL